MSNIIIATFGIYFQIIFFHVVKKNKELMYWIQ